jgi:hypothetical protein
MAKRPKAIEKIQNAHVKVSVSYVEQMTKRMIAWRSSESNKAFFKFLQSENLGWTLFKKICDHYPQTRNEFEVTCSYMAGRWLDFALDNPKMPPHLEKVMLRYLRFYDMHTFEQEAVARGTIEGAKALAIAEYIKEDYAKSQLDAPFKEIYDSATQPEKSGD